MAKKNITKINQITLYCRLFFKAVRVAFGLTHNLPNLLSTLGRILKKNDSGYGRPSNGRRVDGKLYWHMHIPGYPSPAFDQLFRHWLAYNLGWISHPGLCMSYVAITKTCPLNCEHCFEWESINQPETVSEQEIIETVERLINLGATQIIFSGGEPVSRFPLLLRIVNHFHNHSVQLWINTSGIGLTTDRIKQLKKSGLTGIVFSLDHHDRQAHDRFRGREGCHRQVISSVKASSASGLATAFALCTTPDFVSEKNLEAYLQLATDLSLTFIQILEAKPLGKYAGQKVALEPSQKKLLEALYDRAAVSRSEHPLISYPEYHNRRYGCDGGKRHLYVDTEGRAFPCPFCKTVPVAIRDLTPSNLSTKWVCPNTSG